MTAMAARLMMPPIDAGIPNELIVKDSIKGASAEATRRAAIIVLKCLP